jgi:hypothetical protein
MARMIGDPKDELHDGGNASTSPELPPKAIGFGPSMQQRGQAGELLGREPARSPRRGPMAEGLRASLAGTSHPLADSRFAHSHRFRNLALGPPLVLEVPGLQTSGFFPIVL